MQITEIGDNSMVIMKNSNDYMKATVGYYYRRAKKYGDNFCLCVAKENGEGDWHRACDMIYTAGRLILFFKKDISQWFALQDKVILDF